MNDNGVSVIEKPNCYRCQRSQDIVLRRNIAANGTSQVFWYCKKCKDQAAWGGAWIAHPIVMQYLSHWSKTIDDIPVAKDYRQQTPTCIICGSSDTEYHHWFPQKFYDDEEVKPQAALWSEVGAYLCRYHHRLWHRIVTPYMPGIGANRIG